MLSSYLFDSSVVIDPSSLTAVTIATCPYWGYFELFIIAIDHTVGVVELI